MKLREADADGSPTTGEKTTAPARPNRPGRRSPIESPQELLREFALLNGRRKDSGITPLQFQRWLDLCQKLEKAFPGRKPPTGGPIRLLVEFEDRRMLRQAIMANLEPIGLFVPTPFAAEPGTHFELRVRVEETDVVFDSPAVVISNNVGPDFSTQALGMGMRFTTPDCELRKELVKLHA
jgi:hypothetical protein